MASNVDNCRPLRQLDVRMVVGRAREDLVLYILDVPLENIVMGKLEVAEAQAPHGSHYRSRFRQGKMPTVAVSSATVPLSAVQLGHVGVARTATRRGRPAHRQTRWQLARLEEILTPDRRAPSPCRRWFRRGCQFSAPMNVSGAGRITPPYAATRCCQIDACRALSISAPCGCGSNRE